MTGEGSPVIPVGARLGSQRIDRPRAKPVAVPVQTATKVGGNPTITPARGRVTEIASTVLELAGITAIAGGCWLIAPFVGLIVLGISMVVLGVALGWP